MRTLTATGALSHKPAPPVRRFTCELQGFPVVGAVPARLLTRPTGPVAFPGQDRRRARYQKQYQVKAEAKAMKIAVSIHWKAQ